jgi:hypothetical protein
MHADGTEVDVTAAETFGLGSCIQMKVTAVMIVLPEGTHAEADVAVCVAALVTL